jgi:hypothetical protein
VVVVARGAEAHLAAAAVVAWPAVQVRRWVDHLRLAALVPVVVQAPALAHPAPEPVRVPERRVPELDPGLAWERRVLEPVRVPVLDPGPAWERRVPEPDLPQVICKGI